MRRFELVEGSSSKFWEITLSGASFTVRFGRIGTNGQTQEKSFASAEKAKSEHDKLVTEKTKKGYKEIGSAAASAAPTVAAHVAKPASAASAAGSAGSAPATPAATPKKSKPKAAAVEEVAPVESPVAAPVWVGAPTKIVPTDPSTWPAALREELHPTPLSPGPAISLDRAAIWRRVRERAKASKVSASKELKAALARAALEPAPTALADEVTELHMADVLAGSDDPWRDQRALATGLELLVDHWVATGGFAAAVELGFALSRSNRRWLHYGLQTMWLRAASHAAHLSQADRDAAHAQLKKGHQAASTSSGKPDPDSVLAYLFPEHGGGDAIVRGGALNNQLQGGSPLAVAAITELDSLRKVAAMPGGGWLLRTGRSWRAASVEPTAFTFVARFGEAALEPLVELLDKEGHNTDVTLGTARAIGLISSPTAFAVLAARLGDKHVLAATREFAMLSPGPALGAIAQAAAGRTAAAESARTLLGQMLRDASPELSAAEAQLPPALLAVLAEVRSKTAVDREEASVGELPPVLASPPWLSKSKIAEPVVVASVPELAWPDAMKWRAGLKEEWSSYQPSPYLAQRPLGPEVLTRALGLSTHQLEMLERGEALPPESVVPVSKYALHTYAMHFVSTRVANGALVLHPDGRWWDDTPIRKQIATGELGMLEGVLALAERQPVERLPLLLPFASTKAAPIAATALLRSKRAQADARAWLLAHPATAAAGLVPHAVGPKGVARDAAEHALRLLAREGHEATVMEVAARFGEPVKNAVRSVLDFDLRNLVPARMPKLPDFALPSALPRPVLRASGHALPAASMEHVLHMLAISRADTPYLGVVDLKDACTPESLARLGWELFQAWLVAGAPSKEGWAFTQLGWLGDDECARKLAALVRVWPGEAAHQRAVTGLDVLASIGSDVALMHLHGIAQKLKFKGLQEKAREKIDVIADARGLTADELADRLVPDLGLDETGTMVLDFGPRSFRVAFDEALKPFVRDESQARLPDLPKPKKDDDAEKAKAATDAWKALKKDAKTLASQQIRRLEDAMCNSRRWSRDVFVRFLVEHPLVRHLVVRVIWGTYDDANQLLRAFRVAEDGTFADSNDDGWSLPEDARVGVVHALELPHDESARFAQTLADYEVLQPFKQLGRETYALTEEERKAPRLQRWEGREVPTGSVLGLDGHGWRRGQAEDAGIISWFEREVRLDDGKTVKLVLDIEPGIIAGAVMEWDKQKLHGVGFGHGWRWSKQPVSMTLGQLHPIMASEVLRDVEQLFGGGA